MVRSLGINDIIFLLEGLKWTVYLSLIAFFFGAIVGLIISLMRVSKYKSLWMPAWGYIELFQNTPLLMQLFMVYYGVALFNWDISAWVAAAIGLTLHASAYLAEIWRGCIQSIPRGQDEAARSLSISFYYRMKDVILPQAFKISLPATVGFSVGLIKSTSLTAIIGFTELTRSGQVISNNIFQPLMVYSLVGVIYFMLCWPLSYWSSNLERRMQHN